MIAIYAVCIFALSFSLPMERGNFANNPTVRENLASAGLTPEQYDTIQHALAAMLGIVCCCVGVLLLWQRPSERMALFVAFLLIVVPVASRENTTLAALPGMFAFPALVLKWSFIALVVPFFYLFPNGRWVPRWTRWVALLWIVGQMYAVVAERYGTEPPLWLRVLNWPLFLAWVGNFVLVLAAPIYRYIRVSSPVERQQTKWLVVGVAGVFVPLLLFSLLTLVFPSSIPNGSLAYVVAQAFIQIAALLFPISIGLAIFHYRLYDVDLIINRTLVYGTLTVLLATIYFGGVVLVREIFAPFMGGNNQIAIVASTLAIAALFQPLRRRIQSTIDRRFYRRKYDAQTAVQAFSARLREETDLAHLSEDVVQVVHETLQPTHVSLWLREGGLRSVEHPSEAK
jgi:hypothetical protein